MLFPLEMTDVLARQILDLRERLATNRTLLAELRDARAERLREAPKSMDLWTGFPTPDADLSDLDKRQAELEREREELVEKLERAELELEDLAA